MAKVPMADEGRICPLHKADMSTVCHKCPMWTQIRGTNPNTGQPVDDWNCSLAWLPMLLIEGAQQSRQAGAAIESFRNEAVTVGAATIKAQQKTTEAINAFMNSMVNSSAPAIEHQSGQKRPLLIAD